MNEAKGRFLARVESRLTASSTNTSGVILEGERSQTGGWRNTSTHFFILRTGALVSSCCVYQDHCWIWPPHKNIAQTAASPVVTRVATSFCHSIQKKRNPNGLRERAGCIPCTVKVGPDARRPSLPGPSDGCSAVQMGEFNDDDLEPPVPAGLAELKGSLRSLADFLRIDGHLVAAAAEKSEDATAVSLSKEEISKWVGKLSLKEKDSALRRLLGGEPSHVIAELRQRALREIRGKSEYGARRRSVGQYSRTLRGNREAATQAMKSH